MLYILLTYVFTYLLAYVYVFIVVRVNAGTRVEVRGQLPVVSSLLSTVVGSGGAKFRSSSSHSQGFSQLSRLIGPMNVFLIYYYFLFH